MNPERHRRLMDLFDEVCDLDAAARAGRLAALRAEDGKLAEELGAMLAADASGGKIIDEAAAAIAAEFTLAAPGGPAPLKPRPLPASVGGYKVLRVLGEGGMGVVYEAEQELPQRKVAIKVIRGMLATEAMRKRFEMETHILGRLNHPGVCRIYEAATDDEGCFFAMELVDGKPLGAYAVARGLGTPEKLELIARVCDAVHHAHVKGVIHLDLKPANIIVQDDGQPKVLDFGISRIVDPDCAITGLTLTGQILGTPAYMSPEQTSLSADLLDARSDIYTLGAIAYELLTGGLPHDTRGKSVPEVIRLIHDEDPRPVTQVRPDLRGDVETILGKALARDPEMRYQSAAALADDLRRHLRNEPIEARPPTAAYQLWKFAKRNRGLVAALGALLAALVAGTVVSAILATRAERARAAVALRNDALTVLEARASLLEDPTRAAARLKTLSPAAGWDDALAVAHEAEARGVAREVLRGHESEVHAAAFGGRVLATASYDGSLRLWDLAARRVRVVRLGHEVHAVAYAPGGTLAAVGGAGGELALVAADGTTRELAGHAGWIEALAWAPAGDLLASAGADGTVRTWRRDGSAGPVLGAGLGSLNDVVFSPDGARVASAGVDGAVHVFAADGAAPPITLLGHEGEAAALVFSGGDLISAGRDGRILRWDVAAATQRTVFAGSDEMKHLVSAGGALAWAGRDGTVRYLPAAGGEARVVLGHQGVVRGLAFSSDGRYLASCGDDRTVRLVDVRSGDAVTLLGHEGRVRQVAFSDDGALLASVADDGTARVWPVIAPRCPSALRVAASSRGDLAVAGTDRVIRVYGGDGGGGVRLLAGHRDEIYHLAFSPDGARLASGSRDHSVRVWDLAAGTVATLPCPGRVVRVAWSRDGRLAAGVNTGAVVVWEAGGGDPRESGSSGRKGTQMGFSPDEGRVLAAHGDRVNDLVFTPDGKTLLTAGEDGAVRAWIGGEGRLLATVPERATALALAPGGERIGVGAGDGSVRLVTLAGAVTPLGGHAGQVSVLAWSPDGRTLASGGIDRTVRLWREGRAAGVLGGPAGAIVTLAFAPGGGAVLAGAADGTLRALPLAGGPPRLLTRGHSPVLDATLLPDGRAAVVSDEDGVRVVATGPAESEAAVRADLDRLTGATIDDGAGVLHSIW